MFNLSTLPLNLVHLKNKTATNKHVSFQPRQYIETYILPTTDDDTITVPPSSLATRRSDVCSAVYNESITLNTTFCHKQQ